MRKTKQALIFLAAALALSGCSLFEVEDAADTTSQDGASQAVAGAGVSGDEAAGAAARTPAEVLAELQALFAVYGIEGTAEFQDGVWVLRGTAHEDATRAQFIGAARRVEGVNVSRSEIALASPVEDAAGTADEASVTSTEGADGTAPAATETAAGSADAADGGVLAEDTLPLTGIKTNLAVLAMLLIAAGMVVVSTGRHIWLRTQFTNCFRIAPVTTTFTIERRRRRKF